MSPIKPSTTEEVEARNKSDQAGNVSSSEESTSSDVRQNTGGPVNRGTTREDAVNIAGKKIDD